MGGTLREAQPGVTRATINSQVRTHRSFMCEPPNSIQGGQTLTDSPQMLTNEPGIRRFGILTEVSLPVGDASVEMAQLDQHRAPVAKVARGVAIDDELMIDGF